MRNHKCGCGRSSCSNCCPPAKKPGPNIPPCACAQAFDDAFIRSIFAAYSSLDAVATQAFFSPSGCQQFGFDPPTCGTANVQAENQFINDFLTSIGGSLTFNIFNISRTLATDGCTVIVQVTSETVGILPPPIGLIDQRFTTTEIVINPQCQIELIRFFDTIREVGPLPLAASTFRAAAVSSEVPKSWTAIARLYGKKPA